MNRETLEKISNKVYDKFSEDEGFNDSVFLKPMVEACLGVLVDFMEVYEKEHTELERNK